MNFVLNLVVVLQILSALGMIGLILVQHGKGADMGTAFGSGASGSLFGASGSANFLSRSTAVLATIFFVSTLALAYFGFSVRSAPSAGTSVFDRPAAVAPASQGASTPVAADAIPGSAASAPAAAVPAPSASAAGTAAQIPAK